MSMASKPASAANRLNHKCHHMGDFNSSLVTISRQVQEIIQVFSSTHQTSDTFSHSAALRLLNWEEEKGKERWTKVLASKSLRTLEGVEEEEEEVNEEDEEGDDDKKEERMVWPTA